MELSAEKRQIKGTKVKTLRSQGLIPAVVFSKKMSQKGEPTLDISLKLNEFQKVYKEAGESTLIKISINGGEEKQVLISEVQREPMALTPIHVSFYEVDLTEKITANIPVEVIGEENCEPVQSGDGIVLTQLNEIEIQCLPNDLPQNFEVDISKLKEVNDIITVEQGIKVDAKKIEIMNAPEDIILKIDYAEQLEVEEEEMTVDDIEVTTAKEGDEAEEGAGGESTESKETDTASGDKTADTTEEKK